jgi:signal peptidase I
MAGPADAGPAEAGPAEPGPAGPGPAHGKRRRRGRLLLETTVTVAAAVLVSVLLRTFAFETFWIPSGSMEPTLGVYDRVLVQKAFFTWHDVHQGDMVVFSEPPLDNCGGPPGDLVKRVIALPGQTIYSQAGILYVNGKRLAEPYLPPRDPLGPAIPQASARHPYRVPAGEFYMLGDNRGDSCDSRYWGPVQGSTMVGKVLMTWWHASHPVFRWY